MLHVVSLVVIELVGFVFESDEIVEPTCVEDGMHVFWLGGGRSTRVGVGLGGGGVMVGYPPGLDPL